jgi:hypothetical protein
VLALHRGGALEEEVGLEWLEEVTKIGEGGIEAVDGGRTLRRRGGSTVLPVRNT